MVTDFVAIFPHLAGGGFAVTSPRSDKYNCVAWAAGDTNNWWWPDDPLNPSGTHWPAGVEPIESLEAFRDAFATLGYAVCNAEEFEPGFEKVALFANAHADPLHTARQLPNGRWTSKIGPLEDIEHELQDLAGDRYGSVVLVMKRPLPSS